MPLFDPGPTFATRMGSYMVTPRRQTAPSASSGEHRRMRTPKRSWTTNVLVYPPRVRRPAGTCAARPCLSLRRKLADVTAFALLLLAPQGIARTRGTRRPCTRRRRVADGEARHADPIAATTPRVVPGKCVGYWTGPVTPSMAGGGVQIGVAHAAVTHVHEHILVAARTALQRDPPSVSHDALSQVRHSESIGEGSTPARPRREYSQCSSRSARGGSAGGVVATRLSTRRHRHRFCIEPPLRRSPTRHARRADESTGSRASVCHFEVRGARG